MTACETTIEGNPEGPTLVFIHGWPDNASLWRKQVAALASDYLWQGILVPWMRHGILQGYQPKCPVAYVYGTRKPFQFHSEGWLRMVTASGGFARGIDAGHWLQEQRADEVNVLIADWLGVEPSQAADA